ncbi:MAG: MBOAT family O-acyltransferase [Anaerovoracaceae bacterium]|jgi:alginate O-acetyltransferase complex protein AlgI
MSFISFKFIIFLLIVLVLYYIVPKKYQWVFLLAVSYVFYLFSGLKPLIFILLTTLTTYGGARWMENIKQKSSVKKSEAKSKNRRVLILLAVLNFGILGMLKYYNFFAKQIDSLFGLFKYDVSMPLVNIVLPLGISFYTFQAIGYCIDVYRGKYHAETNLLRHALFISFFPQIIQGPISRYDDLGKQLREYHYFSYKNFTYGAQLMLWGFFKKLVIADRAGVLVSQVFSDPGSYDGLQTFVAFGIYAIQIYADFSGGIDIARGAAEMAGIDLIENFRRPYFGTSVAEYWRRWHMSLTNWMKDYVFFPIALSKRSARIGRWARKNMKKGSKIAKQLPTYFPTFVTFFLIGIWHGAGWGYIVYGLYNSIIIVGSMALTPAFDKMKGGLHINDKSFAWKCFCIARTFLIMMYGKAIVRASSVGAAVSMMKNTLGMFHFADFVSRMTSMGLTGRNLVVLFGACVIFFIVSVLQENGITIRDALSKKPLALRWAVLLCIFTITVVFGVFGEGYNASAFVYRNF